MDAVAHDKGDISHHSHNHADGVIGHGIHHDHHGANDYAHTNREFFDKNAHDYDSGPHRQEVVAAIGRAMLKEYEFDEEKTHVLDFACGTGLLSRELAAHTKQIVGVDISQGMVDQYNLRVVNQGILVEEMRAIRADLQGVEGELDNQKFDVVACSMAYHHFGSINDVTRRLAFFLKPAGTLLVADLVKGKNQSLMPSISTNPDLQHIVPHRGGFDEETLRPTFEEAGLGEFTFRPRVRIAQGDKETNIFIAKGVRPAGQEASR